MFQVLLYVLLIRLFAIVLIMVLGCSLTVYADTLSGQQLLTMLGSSDPRDRISAQLVVGEVLFRWDGKSQ
jgi:hypothetical protein